MLLNSLGCLFCAWATNFYYSLNNVFLLRASRGQSTESLIIARLVWTSVLYSLITLLTQTSIFAPLRFLARPEKPPDALFCMKKLAHATYHYYLVSLALMAVWGLLLTRAIPSTLRWLKLEFYVGTMVNHLYATGIDLMTKRIFREET